MKVVNVVIRCLGMESSAGNRRLRNLNGSRNVQVLYVCGYWSRVYHEGVIVQISANQCRYPLLPGLVWVLWAQTCFPLGRRSMVEACENTPKSPFLRRPDQQLLAHLLVR